MRKYIYWIDVINSSGDTIDDFKEWVIAKDQISARQQIEKQYPDRNRYKIMLLKTELYEADQA